MPARRQFCGSACLPGVSARIRRGGPVVDPRRGAPTPAAAPRSPGTGTTPAERRRARRRRRGPPPDVCASLGAYAPPRALQFQALPRVPPDARCMVMRELVEQEGAGGRRRPVDGSHRSGLGLGRRTARRGALRARIPAQNRRAATHATRSGARGAQKLQTAPSGRKPGTQAARRSQAMAPPSRLDGAARTSAPVDRSGPAVEARDQPPGESVPDHARRSSCPPLARPRTPFG